MENKAWHEGCLRISKFKIEVMKLKLNHSENFALPGERRRLTRHEYRIALSELLNDDLHETYNPKERLKGHETINEK